MNTSKLTPLFLLLGMLIIMSLFSYPVQAQTAQPRNQQPNSAYGKPPTNTKKARSLPRKTATPKPANTATKAATRQNTAAPASSTSASQPTQMDTTGTAVSTSNVPATLVTSAAYSATPTPRGMNTIVAQQTKTAGASFLTSTSLALTFTATPTTFGAPTATLTYTPDASELTTTALALTTTPLTEASQIIIASSPMTTVAHIPMSRPELPVTAKGPKWYYLVAVIIGSIILFTLFYLLYKEWKRSSTRSW